MHSRFSMKILLSHSRCDDLFSCQKISPFFSSSSYERKFASMMTNFKFSYIKSLPMFLFSHYDDDAYIPLFIFEWLISSFFVVIICLPQVICARFNDSSLELQNRILQSSLCEMSGGDVAIRRLWHVRVKTIFEVKKDFNEFLEISNYFQKVFSF